MEYNKLHVPKRILIVILILFFFILVISLFLFPKEQTSSTFLNSENRDTAMNLQQIVRPDGLPINLGENSAIFRLYRIFRFFLNFVFLILNKICIAWLSIYAYYYFHKKVNKPVHIIAVSIGGHAPPFSLA